MRPEPWVRTRARFAVPETRVVWWVARRSRVSLSGRQNPSQPCGFGFGDLGFVWDLECGHPIYRLETFVEQARFTGTCDRAAGWVQVGLTTGRTHNDDGCQPRAARKAIFLKALRADARRRLAV